jgi:FkbM family methyltransferase
MKTTRPIAFVMVAVNHGTMLVNRNDYHLVDGGGYGVGYQLLNTSSFDQGEISLALALLQQRKVHFGSGVVAIDCGANIGVHTIEWAKAMYGWGEVISIEAQERIFYALAGNVAMNNCFNARAVWGAVGASNGTIAVPQLNYMKPASYGSLELRKKESNEFIGQEIEYETGASTETRLFSLDSLSFKRVDLIKIDIEGMEMEALIGAEQLLRQFKPILIVEKIKSKEGEIVLFLESLGYKTFPIGINILGVHKSDPTLSDLKITQ